jgi:taurine transport system substrate-binding protein
MTKSHKDRRWPITAAVVGIAVALSAVACGSDSSSDSGTAAAGSTSATTPSAQVTAFNMGRFVAPTTILAGEALDSFEGLPMKMVDVESGPIALPLLATGKLAGISDVSENPIVIAFSRDIPVKIVWTSNKTPLSLVAKSGITDAQGLRGKKVAAAGGSVLQYVLERYLAQNGMKLSDVKFVDLAPPDMVGALRNGAIQAGYAWPPASTAMEAQGAKAIATSQSTNLTIFSKKFVDEHPETVQAFVCKMAAIAKQFVDQPDGVYSALGKRLNLSAKAVRPLLPAQTVVQASDAGSDALLAPGGRIAQQVAGVGKWLLAEKQVPKAPSLEDVNAMIDTRFVQGVDDGKCT